MKLIGQFLAYLAVATVITGLISLGVLMSKGALTRKNLVAIAGLAQGVPLEQLYLAENPPDNTPPEEQPSLEDIARQRALENYDFELRETSLERDLHRWQYEMSRVASEKQEFDRLRTAFEQSLKSLQDQAVVGGEQAVRATIERSQPKAAKAQLLEMIKKGEIDVVVSLLSDMPIANRTKIVAEFKTPEEIEQLDEIYRLMRQGLPDSPLIKETQAQLGTPAQAP